MIGVFAAIFADVFLDLEFPGDAEETPCGDVTRSERTAETCSRLNVSKKISVNPCVVIVMPS